MATNKQITDRFWEDAINEGWSHEEISIWQFLCTCPQSEVSGLFTVAIPTIAHFTKLGIGSVTRGMKSLESRGKLVYDSAIVFIEKYAENQNATKLGYFVRHLEKIALSKCNYENRSIQAFFTKYLPLLKRESKRFEEIVQGLPQPFIAIAITIPDKLDNPNRGSGGKTKTEEIPEELDAEFPTVEWKGKRGVQNLRTFEEILPPTLNTPDVLARWREWIVMRKTHKCGPVTKRAAELARNELLEIEDDPIAVIEQTLGRNWATFYPLKVKNPKYVNAAGIHARESRPKSDYHRRATRNIGTPEDIAYLQALYPGGDT